MKKELIKAIIEEIISGKRLSSIMLKVQILASALKNEDFMEWVQNEIDGYNGNTSLPEYRRIEVSSLKVYNNDYSSGYKRTFIIPVHAVVDSTLRIRVSKVYFRESVLKLEELIGTKDIENTIILQDVIFYSFSIRTDIDNKYLNWDSGVIGTFSPIISIHAIEEMIDRIKSYLLSIFY